MMSQQKKGSCDQESKWLATEMVLRHKNEVATQNSVKGGTARSRHGIEVATQILGDQKKLSQQES